MPIHDWTRADAGVFHHFHGYWIGEIARSLNGGLLPEPYYALAEQVTGDFGPDVLTLDRQPGRSPAVETESAGGIAVAMAPPRVRYHAQREMDIYAAKARTVVIRHRSRNRIVAIVEIVSPGNKGGRIPFAAFIRKAEQALLSGINLLIVDLLPPTARDPDGIHRAIWDRGSDGDFALPGDKRLTCVSYVGYPSLAVYLEPVAVGDPLPDMPLFLTPEVYVAVPLEATYIAAWEAVPAFLREAIAATAPDGRKKSRRRRKRE